MRQATGFALGAAVLAGLSCCGGVALAAPPQVQVPTEETLQQSEGGLASGGALGFLGNIQRSNYLLGDMWGVRPLLGQYGMTFALQETSEVLGNVTGGSKKGFDYDGLTTMVLQLDTRRAFGWYGGLFNASALQYHGRNLSADNLQNLQTASGIEADRATRLWELWYDQKFLDEDRLSVRIGQQSLDQEFMVSQGALLFVNTMFGWPMVPSADMPGGGPAYPLSALGVRFKARPLDSVTVLAGVFNGAPARNTNGDAQLINPSGTQFPLNGGTLAIAELQYSYPALGSMIYANESAPLSRVYKIGIWYDTESFADQRFDNTGLSLADPGSTGIAQPHRGNYSIYAVADQMVWQDPDEADRTFNLFFRAMGTPEVNRNLIDFSLNAGFTFKEPFLHRDDDTFGMGLGWAKVSPRVAGLDRDAQAFSGSFTPAQTSETFVEATYQYAVTPWLQVQPDIQYVFNPGGGVPNNSGTARIKDELVMGVRTNIQF
ncbi:MAG TPA: carbohydrate porin [Stellaceae bacterium]|jgi:porin|nr:carbohydrate porin [Stellaceae bacterium]